jgi:hypothetical protein
MRSALKILSITFLVIGGIAILASVGSEAPDLAGVVGGLAWVGYSICVLVYLNQTKS